MNQAHTSQSAAQTTQGRWHIRQDVRSTIQSIRSPLTHRGRALVSVALSVVLAAALLLVGCSQSQQQAATDTPQAGSETLSIIATIFAPYDFARQVAGDEANLRMLVPPGAETHSFEPTPQDIIDIEQCDVFIYVGGESDEWVSDLLESLDTSGVTVIKLVDCVLTLAEDDSVLANPEEAEEEEEEGLPDEHVWTSPRNAQLITSVIAEALMSIDSDNAATYQENMAIYLEKLNELDLRFRDVIAQGTRTELVFADRFPFRYFADEYGLTCYAAFPGCSTATEASAQTIAALIDIVKRDDIPVVLYRELSDHKMADAIAEETGAQALPFHSCHNISKEDFDAGATYLSLMEQNADTLKIALD